MRDPSRASYTAAYPTYVRIETIATTHLAQLHLVSTAVYSNKFSKFSLQIFYSWVLRLPSRSTPTAASQSLENIPLHVPRLVALRKVHPMLIVARQLLLVHAAVRLPVPPHEPAQPVRLPVGELARHLGAAVLGRAHKVVQHLALVDEGQHRRDRVGLPRQERVPPPEEDDARRHRHVQQ